MSHPVEDYIALGTVHVSSFDRMCAARRDLPVASHPSLNKKSVLVVHCAHDLFIEHDYLMGYIKLGITLRELITKLRL
jgi:hypothetical protein